MKRRTFLSVIALIMTLVFIIIQASMLAGCKKSGEGEEASSATIETDTPEGPDGPDGPDDPDGIDLSALKYYDTAGKEIFRGNFSADMTSPVTPAFYPVTLKGEDSALCSVGFLWNASELALIISSVHDTEFILQIGGYEKKISVSANSKDTLRISFEDIGMAVYDLGQLIPVTFISASDSEKRAETFVELTDYEVCFSYGGSSHSIFETASTIVAGSSAKPDKAAAGIESDSGALHLYDRYENGKGHPMTQHKLVKKEISSLSLSTAYAFEMSLTVNAMPIYPVTYINAYSTYGLYFNISAANSSPSPLFVLLNTESGLSVATLGEDSGSVFACGIGKTVGETFTLTVECLLDGKLALYVDGEFITEIENSLAVRKQFPSNSLSIVWQRTKDDFNSAEGDMDTEIHSICLYRDRSKSLTDSMTVEKLYENSKPVVLDSNQIYLAPEKLILAEEVSSRQYGITAPIIWSSSMEEVISSEGILSTPSGSSEFVTLSLYLTDGEYIIAKKDFRFFAKGESPSTDVLFRRSDTDPFGGKGISADTVYEFNANLNSIIYDMGSVTRINRAEIINSIPSVGFVNKNLISLYYSNDNVTYTYIKNYSVLPLGDTLYFYNFDVEARYLKIHSTHNYGLDSSVSFVGSLQNMMKAYYSDTPLLSNGDFKLETSVKVKNGTDGTLYDSIYSFTLEDMGISGESLKSDMSDIRFVLDGVCLPHYYDGSRFHVRVFELSAGKEATVRVLYGNREAISVSNGNETFEIQYGTKYATKRTDEQYWISSIAEMPNGDILKMTNCGNGSGKQVLAYYRSTDGGHSYTGLHMIDNSTEINSGGGFIVDKKAGKVFYFGFHFTYEPFVSTFFIYESNDSGHTWTGPVSPSNAPAYSLNYSDGITLSTADGDGPNVDYLITAGCSESWSGGFGVGVINSCDGGKTWQFCNDAIQYTFPGYSNTESGMSEATVYEQNDGTVILYARCQHPDNLHFAISRSRDRGLTWEKVTDNTFSNVYTPNTQPIIEDFGGIPTLMWGGNNSIGGSSYRRFPLSLAYSKDDGDSFTGIMDLSFQTVIAAANRQDGEMLHTNPDNVIYSYGGVDCMSVVSTHHNLMITNLGDYLYKTKGAFDSFEEGITPEGWMAARGTAYLASVGATDGKYAMNITGNSTLTRALHYMEEGSISFDLYVSALGKGFTVELQTAYNDVDSVTAPVRISADSEGNLYTYTNDRKKEALGLTLRKGSNSLSIDFDGNAKTLKVTLNGETARAEYIGEDISVSFAAIFTKAGVDMALDRFIAIKEK